MNYEIIDVSRTNQMVLEKQVKTHIARTNGEMRRVVKESIDRNQQVLRIPMSHIKVLNIGGASIQVLKT